MAYATKIAKPRCPCRRPASFLVFNRFNCEVGYFCSKCSREKVAELDERERRDVGNDGRVHSREAPRYLVVACKCNGSTPGHERITDPKDACAVLNAEGKV